jgi:hypothetical protein
MLQSLNLFTQSVSLKKNFLARKWGPAKVLDNELTLLPLLLLLLLLLNGHVRPPSFFSSMDMSDPLLTMRFHPLCSQVCDWGTGTACFVDPPPRDPNH